MRCGTRYTRSSGACPSTRPPAPTATRSRRNGERLRALGKAFPLQTGQCGAVLAIGNDLCLDGVSRPDAFTLLWPKLRTGYLLDALERLDQQPTRPERIAAGGHHVRSNRQEAATPHVLRSAFAELGRQGVAGAEAREGAEQAAGSSGCGARRDSRALRVGRAARPHRRDCHRPRRGSEPVGELVARESALDAALGHNGRTRLPSVAGGRAARRQGCKGCLHPRPDQAQADREDAATGEARDSFYVAGFTGVPVFRIEDTDGPPVASSADYRPAEWPPLYEVAGALGVSVTYGPSDGRFRGSYSPGAERIVLCTEDTRTYFHELAHAAHARVLRERGEDVRGGQVASQEIAETVAATLCRLYDLDGYLYHGAEYVSRYANGGNPARAAIKVLGDVQACLYLILETAIEAGANVPEPVAA